MADTVPITAGSGTTIGTDEVTIGGTLQHVQRVKLVDGADGGTALIGGTANGLYVDGSIAHDAVDAGNPIKIGGKANSATPTVVAAADRVDAWFGTQGAQAVFLVNSATGGVLGTNTFADANAATIGMPSSVFGHVYNGTNWDRARTVESVSAAPNVDTGIPAAGIGPGFDRKTNPTGVAATSTANAVTVLVNGASVVTFHVTVIGTTPGSMILETTADDTNWVTAGFVVQELGGPDTRIEGSFVPAVNDVYRVMTVGIRQVRYRVNAVYASGTATVKVTTTAGTAMVKSVDVAPAPHNIGYALVGVSAQYTSAQTSTTVGPTVSATQRMVVTSIQIQCGGTVATTQVSVYFGTGAFSRGTSRTVFDGEFAPSATSKPGFAIAPSVPYMGAADEELKITNVGAANPLTITIWYYLISS